MRWSYLVQREEGTMRAMRRKTEEGSKPYFNSTFIFVIYGMFEKKTVFVFISRVSSFQWCTACKSLTKNKSTADCRRNKKEEALRRENLQSQLKGTQTTVGFLLQVSLGLLIPSPHPRKCAGPMNLYGNHPSAPSKNHVQNEIH